MTALQVGDGENFDTLLNDAGLADGDGWALPRRLDAAPAGHRPSDAAARSKAAGCALHLVKPFGPEDLEKALLAAQARVSCAAS